MKRNVQGQSLRPQQAADFLGIHVATLWKWSKARPNMPKPLRISTRCTVFDRDELLAWRNAQPAGK